MPKVGFTVRPQVPYGPLMEPWFVFKAAMGKLHPDLARRGNDLFRVEPRLQHLELLGSTSLLSINLIQLDPVRSQPSWQRRTRTASLLLRLIGKGEEASRDGMLYLSTRLVQSPI